MTRTLQPSIDAFGQRGRRVVQERRLHLLELERQRDPGLDAVQTRRAVEIVAGPLRMHDAAARRHEIHGAGLDQLPVAQAVAMQDLAFEQVRDRRETDVRMRPYRYPVTGREDRRPHVVEKHERADHAPLGRRQHAPDVELAQAAHARLDRELDRCAAPRCVPASR